MKQVIYGAIGYSIVVFVWAILWHVVLFRDFYTEIGLFGTKEPIFVFGLLSIIIQGAILSSIYPKFATKPGQFAQSIRFNILAFLFLWSSHVLAFAAKNQINNVPAFIGVETFYLIIQFGLFSLLLHFIYRK